MKQNRISILPSGSFALPPAAITTTVVVYLLLSLILAFIMPVNPVLGIVGAIAINLVMLFFLRSGLALPLYIILAGPSLGLALGHSGLLSRLFIGDLIFGLVFIVWVLQTILPLRKSGQRFLDPMIMAPIGCLILVGLISIIYSRLAPDPKVIYTYPHSTISINIVNLVELAVLIGLPMILIIIPTMVRRLRDIRWAIIAFAVVGWVYAIATNFAGPLGLLGHEALLGNRRPKIFGTVSSTLGTMIVIFTAVALGQTLYAKTVRSRILWAIATLLFSIAVILAFGREAWVGLFLIFMVMISLRVQNWSAIIIFILITPLVLLLIIVLVPGVTDFFNPAKVYGSDRLIIWQDAIMIWQHSPIFGVGAGNYQFFDRTYSIDKVGVAHNQYLEILAEMGLQGLICYLWLLTAIGIRSLKAFFAAKTRIARSIALTQIGVFVTILMGGFFEDFFLPSAASGGGTGAFIEASYRWILLGLVLSIPTWSKEAEQAENEVDLLETTAMPAQYAQNAGRVPELRR
ncbi:MAG TPA: O-antigen ligase family protein [Ktedonobacteraceae bacterium]|nr:O-antigen ligase family protein [Ktedonobacteraceae bacterium]